MAKRPANVLLLTRSSHPEGVDFKRMRSCKASLHSMGLTYERRMFVNGSSFSATESASINNLYDMIVMPSFNAGTAALFDDPNITIPIFTLSGDGPNSVAGYGATPGVTGAVDALSNQWVKASFTNEKWFAAYGRSYELSTGTPIISIADTDAFTGAALPLANHVMCWSTTRGGGAGKLYCSAMGAQNMHVLHFLIQEAINDGELLSVPRKSPMVMDLDHINNNITEPEIIDKIASYVPAGGTIWCGIYNLPSTAVNLNSDVVSRLKKYSGAPFKYCWHDHRWVVGVDGLMGENLDSSGYSTDHSKADVDTEYNIDKAVWESNGLEFHTPIHYDSGSNSWDEGVLELYSRNVSKISSPNNDTVQAGYGAKVFRQIGYSGICSRNFSDTNNLWSNQHKERRKIRGVQLFTTMDLSASWLLPYNTIGKWKNNFRYICQSFAMGQILYLHGTNFKAAEQDPGVLGKHHGFTAMQLFTDIGTHLKDVTNVFADSTDYVS